VVPANKQVSGVLERAAKDITAQCSGVTQISWNDGNGGQEQGPYMVTVLANGSRIRAFVEPSVLAERGEAYQGFLAKIGQQVIEGLGRSERDLATKKLSRTSRY
jgi:hypothetical protein